MRSFNKKAVLIAVIVMLMAAVLPASAGRPGIDLSAQTVDCTIVIEFTMPFPLQSRLDTKIFARVAAGGGTNTVYVLIFDNGVLIASIPVTGPIGSVVQALYQVDRYYDLEDIDIAVSDEGTGAGFYYGAIEAYSVPNSVYDSCQGEEPIVPTVASPACPYPLSPTTLGQGRVIFPTEVFWGPSFNTLTNVVLPVGTSWWIIEARDGFYKLFVACQAQYVWVPAESLGANFDVVWGGRPLPPAGDQAE